MRRGHRTAPVLAARVTTDDDGTPHLAPAETRPTVTVGELTDARVAEEIARPHDLRTGPLARFTLLTGADGTHLLLVTAHHLAFDGMSKDVLARDLAPRTPPRTGAARPNPRHARTGTRVSRRPNSSGSPSICPPPAPTGHGTGPAPATSSCPACAGCPPVRSRASP